MGLEARCRVRIGDDEAEASVLLESRVLQVRRGLRLDVDLSTLEAAAIEGAFLVLESEGRSVRIELGDAAGKWLEKIKNPKGLFEKLGVRPDHKVWVLGVRDEAFVAELKAKARSVAVGTRGRHDENDAVFVGAESRADLERFALARSSIKPTGAVWLVRPKGKKEITEADGMAAGKAAGLVDVKVVAFSPTHTAEKFVIRVADRAPPRPKAPRKP
jgi:hypothetical protein